MNVQIDVGTRQITRRLARRRGGADVGRGVALAGGASAATTLIVDDDLACPGSNYPTIAAAVAAAQGGDTIQVCAGDYFENVTDGNKDLHFVGPQAGVDPRGASYPRPGGEAKLESV